ncbi:PH domain-containing protein [Streptomyces sp. NRRL S-337]|uniref:PH domain-containing protein n=1 Tax=Streptomyces sp. NRRL S-337 TaxID=1463900 RepID=UPI000AA84544|nr:PH domain-containing protein [Streptomyces sp. NRRL S-337]
MLAVHPLHEALRFLPVVLSMLFLGRRGEQLWGLLGLAFALVIGLARWFTTTYRVTAHQVQLRRGLVRREVLSVPRDRIRSVDVSSRVLQRMLRLQRLVIGTGRSDRRHDGMVLDALDVEAAERLRDELLTGPGQTDSLQPAAAAIVTADKSEKAEMRPVRRVTPPRLHRPDELDTSVTHLDALGEQLISELRPSWIRFGAFTLTGTAGAGVLITSLITFLNDAQLGPGRFPPLRLVYRQVTALPMPLAVLASAALAVLVVSLLSAVGYALAFWHFRLTRLANGTLRLTRGLVTKRSVTIEGRRLRGIEISETLPLRLVRGARCTAITTGLRTGRGAEHGSSLLLPAAPLAEAHRVGAVVFGDAAPMDCPLVQHGEGARNRRCTRARITAVGVSAAVGGAALWAGWPAWIWFVSLAVLLPFAELIARDRYRSLGHAWVDGQLVGQQGGFVRRRFVLSEEAAVGWIFHRSMFQRRAGLASLTVATAAGRQFYSFIDLPGDSAAALASDATPGWLEPFLAPASEQPVIDCSA